MLACLRLCLLLGVILGVVLPKTSAALVDSGLVQANFVVICTGHGLQEILLDDEGQPTEPSQTVIDAPCLLVHALDGVVPPAVPAWVEMARAIDAYWAPQARQDKIHLQSGFARAPPRA